MKTPYNLTKVTKVLFRTLLGDTARPGGKGSWVSVVDRVVAVVRPGRWGLAGPAGLALAAGLAVAETYLMARQPTVAGLVVFLAVTIPLALLRPDLFIVGLIPVSVVMGVFGLASEFMLAGTLLLVPGVLAGRLLGNASRASTGPWGSPGPWWSPGPWGSPGPRASTGTRASTGPWLLGAGALLLLLTASLTVGDRAGYGAPPLPVDFPDIVVGLLLLMAAVVCPPRPRLLAGMLALTGAGAAAYLLVIGAYVHDRLSGVTINPNYLGALLAGSLAAAVGLARGRRFGWLVPAALCGVGVVQTHSRGALIAALVGVAVAVTGGRSKGWRLAGLAGAGFGVAILFTVANQAPEVAFGDRTAEQLTANTAIRADALRLALDLAVTHPVRGVGFSLFPYLARADPRLGVFINTHNDYLKLAAECGLLTLVVFVALLAAGLTGPARPELVGIRAMVAAGAVTLLFVNALSNEAVGVGFWVCLGCLLAARAAPVSSGAAEHLRSKENSHG